MDTDDWIHEFNWRINVCSERQFKFLLRLVISLTKQAIARTKTFEEDVSETTRDALASPRVDNSVCASPRSGDQNQQRGVVSVFTELQEEEVTPAFGISTCVLISRSQLFAIVGKPSKISDCSTPLYAEKLQAISSFSGLVSLLFFWLTHPEFSILESSKEIHLLRRFSRKFRSKIKFEPSAT